MLDEILASANALQQMTIDGLVDWTGTRLFTRSGWKLDGDTDTGLSFGEGLEGGVGYMEMDIVDLRVAGRPVAYEARGGYAEFGFGLGPMSKGQGFINAIVKRLKGFKPSSDLIFLPGGGITELLLGPNYSGGQLTKETFSLGSFIYVHLGGELAVGAIDGGVMFLVDPVLYLELTAETITNQPLFMVKSLLSRCIAWSPYWGVSMGLGVGGKFAMRGIQTVDLRLK